MKWFVTEETIPTDPIIQLLAVDDGVNQTITFELLTHASLFRIDQEGYVRLLTPLDFELVTEYVVRVRLFDGTHYSIDNAVIHLSVYPVNEHRPEFDQNSYQMALAENSPPGSLQIELSVQDQDVNPPSEILSQLGSHGDILSVDFHSGDSEHFTILYDPETQVATITNKISFDFEASPAQFTFEVIAQDGGLLSSLPVQVQVSLIDVNDEKPVFSA